MEDDIIFNLLDSCWFHHQILNKQPISSPPISTTSMDDLVSTSSFTCFSPSSVLPAGRLPTIFSGKVPTETETPTNRATDQKSKKKKKKLQRGMSKSLTDLEFEELKGFIDLGFSFSEEDKNSEFLAKILPGLQRLGLEGEIKKQEEEEKQAMKVGVRRRSVDESGFSRPDYLKMQRRKKHPLKTTSLKEIPALGSEVSMKDYLRSWAHSVASSVR